MVLSMQAFQELLEQGVPGGTRSCSGERTSTRWDWVVASISVNAKKRDHENRMLLLLLLLLLSASSCLRLVDVGERAYAFIQHADVCRKRVGKKNPPSPPTPLPPHRVIAVFFLKKKKERRFYSFIENT
jgi:hypothetical protein